MRNPVLRFDHYMGDQRVFLPAPLLHVSSEICVSSKSESVDGWWGENR